MWLPPPPPPTPPPFPLCLALSSCCECSPTSLVTLVQGRKEARIATRRARQMPLMPSHRRRRGAKLRQKVCLKLFPSIKILFLHLINFVYGNRGRSVTDCCADRSLSVIVRPDCDLHFSEHCSKLVLSTAIFDVAFLQLKSQKKTGLLRWWTRQ